MNKEFKADITTLPGGSTRIVLKQRKLSWESGHENVRLSIITNDGNRTYYLDEDDLLKLFLEWWHFRWGNRLEPDDNPIKEFIEEWLSNFRWSSDHK